MQFQDHPYGRANLTKDPSREPYPPITMEPSSSNKITLQTLPAEVRHRIIWYSFPDLLDNSILACRCLKDSDVGKEHRKCTCSCAPNGERLGYHDLPKEPHSRAMPRLNVHLDLDPLYPITLAISRQLRAETLPLLEKLPQSIMVCSAACLLGVYNTTPHWLRTQLEKCKIKYSKEQHYIYGPDFYHAKFSRLEFVNGCKRQVDHLRKIHKVWTGCDFEEGKNIKRYSVGHPRYDGVQILLCDMVFKIQENDLSSRWKRAYNLSLGLWP